VQDPAGPKKTAAGHPPAPDCATTNSVERATVLRGLSIARPQTPKSTLRRQGLQDIRSKDPEIPYQIFENAARDLVCSLMERQDRMNEEIFNKLVDLEYSVNDIELDITGRNEKRRS
jgi:hypothetical protein